MNVATSWVGYLIPAALMVGMALFPMLKWLSKKSAKDNQNKN
jgi:hypothetical protein